MMRPKLSLGQKRKSSLGSRRSSVQPVRLRPGDVQGLRVEALLPKGQTLKRTTSSDRLTSNRFSQRRSVSADRISRAPSQLFQNTDRVSTNPLKPNYNSTPDVHFTTGGGVESFYKLTLALGQARKDTRNLNDKSAQTALTEKIESYFRKDLKTSSFVQNGFNFRNITLRQYVDMMHYLLSQFWPADSFNLQMSNYTEKVIYYMKKLGYPGKLNKAWLQTANTQGSWPQVLGTLSWLIDFIEYGRRGTDPLNKMTDAETSCGAEECVPPQILLVNLLSQYDKWLKEDYKGMDELVDNLRSIAEINMNLDNHEYSVALQTVTELEAQLEAKNLPYRKNLKENVEKKRKHIAGLQKEINKVTKDKEYLLQNLQASQCERADLEKIQKRNQDIVDQLKQKVKEQSVFLEGREQIMNEKIELERAIHNIENHKKFCEKELHNDLIVTNRAKDKLNSLCLEFNNNIVCVVSPSESAGFMVDTKVLTSDHSHVDENLKKLMAERDMKIEESKKVLKDARARVEEAKEFLAQYHKELDELQDSIEVLKKSEDKLHQDHKKNVDSLKKQAKKYEKAKEREKKELEELPELKEYEKLKEEKKAILEKTAFVERRSEEVLSRKVRHLRRHLKNLKDMNLFKFSEE